MEDHLLSKACSACFPRDGMAHMKCPADRIHQLTLLFQGDWFVLTKHLLRPGSVGQDCGFTDQNFMGNTSPMQRRETLPLQVKAHLDIPAFPTFPPTSLM